MEARSAQTYKLIIDDDDIIKSILKKIPKEKDFDKTNKENYPCIVASDIQSKTPSAIINVFHIDANSNTIESIFIKFDIENKRCYIIGNGKAREKLVFFLNNLINQYKKNNEDTKVNYIQSVKLDGRSIFTNMLDILHETDDAHFIKTLKAEFGIFGYKSPLDDHKVETIQYGFTKNRCASAHDEALGYVEKSQKITIKFGVWKIGDFVKPRIIKVNNKDQEQKPFHFDVNTDYAFRFWYGYDSLRILRVMEILNVDFYQYPPQ